jgi:hypothetical protein
MNTHSSSGAFSPIGANVTLAVIASSTSVAVNPPGSTGGNVRILNLGTGVVYVAFGGASVVATVPGSMPLVGGPSAGVAVERVFTFPPGATHVAAIMEGTGNTLHIQCGLGE